MCYSPIRTRTGLLVGCGHCLSCLKAYQDQWTARLSEEAKCWRPDGVILPIVFFTLKYRNDSVPCKYLYATPYGYDISPVRPDDLPKGVSILDEWTDTRRETRTAWESRHARNLALWKHHVKTVKSDPDNYKEVFPRCPAGVYPIEFGLEFHSVCKKDVQDWLKRGRIMAERKKPDVFAQDCNPRFRSKWTDTAGQVHSLPSCAVPKNIKYFITSEYGPRTSRPHYHGVMFGVTFNEFKQFFAKDWEENFGSVDFSAYDPSKGGMLYVSKYCSKGGYEHPYCRKDFFYAGSLKEYHSKNYEDCIRDFCVNEALVEPTFHLISKGLGTSYCFSVEIQNYFGARLEEYVTPSGRVNYRVCDNPSKPSYFPSLGLEKSTFRSRVIEISDVPGGFLIRKYAYPSIDQRKAGLSRGALIGESFLPSDAIINSAFEQGLLSKKYNRSYVKAKHSVCHSAWHLIGHGVSEVETRTTSITLPRYYRRWLLSPLASALRTSAAFVLHPDLDAELSRVILEGGPCDPRIAGIQSLMAFNEAQQLATAQKLRKHSQNFLQGSKF